jgi:hypothetical protein
LPNTLTAFYWLSNEEVMFAAWPVTPRGEQEKPPGIYVWDVRKNTYRKYADLSSPLWIFNYDNRNILFTQEPIRTEPLPTAYMVGKIGEEQRQELTHSQFRASSQIAAALGPKADRMYQPGDGTISLVYHLRPEHGMLVVQTRPVGQNIVNIVSEGGDAPVRFLRPSGGPAEVLPIVGRELGAESEVWYSEYLGRYVILPAWHRTKVESFESDFVANEARPVYLLSPDGNLRTEEIPSGPWSAGAVFPTRSGLFWISNLALKDWKEAGGWLLENGRPKKLFDLPVDGISVSPDGCTISYAVGNYGGSEPWIAQALRLCSNDGE